ncbi:MAG: hypothetical protein JNM93_02630 [Bacteriovoracaceae bacterium]|nr:hypothetical protein [Bacteriovoracaceae bacterium]
MKLTLLTLILVTSAFTVNYFLQEDEKVSVEIPLRAQLLNPEQKQTLSSLKADVQKIYHSDDAIVTKKLWELSESYQKGAVTTEQKKAELKFVKEAATSEKLKERIQNFLNAPEDLKVLNPMIETGVNLTSMKPYKNSEEVNLEKLDWSSSAWAYLTGENDTYTCTDIGVVNPNPTGAALTDSDVFTARTQTVVDLANQLVTPAKIFNYVKTTIKFSPLYGAAQSAEQVIRSGRGSSFDKSTLLIALLRAKGIAASYKIGEILLEEEKLMALYEVTDNEEMGVAHLSVLNQYFTDFDVIYYRNGKRTWAMPHTWVSAYIDNQWIDLDSLNDNKQTQDVEFIDSSERFGASLIASWLSNEKSHTIVDEMVKQAPNALEIFSNTVETQINGSVENILTIGVRGQAHCLEAQATSVPTQYQFKGRIATGPVSSRYFNITLPLPNFASGKTTLSHTAGLLSIVGGKSGSLQLKVGTEVIAQRTMNTGIQFDIEREAIFPERYTIHSSPRVSQRISGGVSVFDMNIYGANSKDIEIQMQEIKSLKTANPREKMLGFLSLAGKLYDMRANELVSDLGKIRGMRIFSFRNAEVFTSSGVLIGRSDRVFGEVPVGTTIDIREPYLRYFVDSSFRKTESSEFDRDFIVIGSELEHKIWEELYGVPGASAVKAIQLKAQQGSSNVIIGQVVTKSNVNSALSGLASNLNSLKQGLIQQVAQDNGQTEIYTVKNRLVLSSGWEGGGYITVGNSGSSAIIYTFVSPRTTSNGGVTTGDPASAGFEPTDVAFNSPDNTTVCTGGDPVNTATGAMWDQVVDFNIAGRTASTNLKFVRTYMTKSPGTTGDLGTHWHHNYEERLTFPFLNQVVYFSENGGAWTFTKSGANFINPKGYFGSLTEFSDRYEMLEVSGVIKTYSKGNPLISNGRLLKIRDPHGEEVILTYLNNKLESVESPLAGEITFARNGQGRISQITRERDNLTIDYNYNAQGKLSEVVDIDDENTTYEYVTDMPGTLAQGLLKSKTNKLGHVTEFNYFEDGRVFEEIMPEEGKMTYLYSPFFNNRFTRVRGENGEATEFRFDDNYRLSETVFANRARRQIEWTTQNLPSTITDELGYTTDFTYNSRGMRTGVKRPEHSSFSTITYHPNYNLPTLIVPLTGSSTTLTIDPNDADIVSITRTDSQGNLSLGFTHDNFGNILQTSNGLANYSNVTNTDGQLTQAYDARNTETRTYDSSNRLHTRTFANGRVITLEYDVFDRITEIQDSHGPEIEQVYDVLGRLTSRNITDGSEDQLTTFEYDGRNRLTAIVDPQNRRTEISYNIYALGCGSVDKPVMIKDPAGRKTQMIYDNMTRLITVIDPQNGKTQFEYNLRGDRTAVIDPEGNKTNFEFDGNRRLVKRIRRVIRTGENNKPNLANQVTRFIYDQADRLVREETDLLSTQNGTETGVLVTELTYDLLDRVSRKVIKKEIDGETEILDDSNFTYSRQLDVTRLATANNETMNLTFDYENTPPFAITSYTTESVDSGNPLDLIEGSFVVTPHQTGEIGAISKDSNTLYTKTYDAAARLTGVSSSFASQSYSATIIRDAFGRKTNVNHSTGLQGVYGYDNLNRIDSITWDGAGEDFNQDINYNALTGNIDQIIREIGSFSYTHDSLDQLTGVNYSGSETLGPLVTNRTMSYDKGGNRIDDSFYGETKNVRNTILNNEAFTYFTDRDGLGDIIQKSNATEMNLFEYRGDKKLKHFTLIKNNETTHVSYFYDALGRRVAKQVQTPTENFTNTFAYEADQDKILIGKNGLNQETLYVDGQGIDEHLGQVNSSSVKGYTVNHLGTILNSSAVGASNDTGSFGEVLDAVSTINSSTESVCYGFTGRQLDLESKTYYYRNRQYDQDGGKFLSEDPIGFEAGDYNIQRYVLNSPLNNTDPSGEISIPQAALIGAMLATPAATRQIRLSIAQDKIREFRTRLEDQVAVGRGSDEILVAIQKLNSLGYSITRDVAMDEFKASLSRLTPTRSIFSSGLDALNELIFGKRFEAEIALAREITNRALGIPSKEICE